MKSMRIILLALSCASFMYVANAQDSEPQAPSPPPDPQAESDPPPPSSDEIFIPSEEIAADEEVIFPVGI